MTLRCDQKGGGVCGEGEGEEKKIKGMYRWGVNEIYILFIQLHMNFREIFIERR